MTICSSWICVIRLIEHFMQKITIINLNCTKKWFAWNIYYNFHKCLIKWLIDSDNQCCTSNLHIIFIICSEATVYFFILQSIYSEWKTSNYKKTNKKTQPYVTYSTKKQWKMNEWKIYTHVYLEKQITNSIVVFYILKAYTQI